MCPALRGVLDGLRFSILWNQGWQPRDSRGLSSSIVSGGTALLSASAKCAHAHQVDRRAADGDQRQRYQERWSLTPLWMSGKLVRDTGGRMRSASSLGTPLSPSASSSTRAINAAGGALIALPSGCRRQITWRTRFRRPSGQELAQPTCNRAFGRHQVQRSRLLEGVTMSTKVPLVRTVQAQGLERLIRKSHVRRAAGATGQQQRL